MGALFTLPAAASPGPALRVLVVDDEPTARHRIIRLLGTMSGVQVVGQCGSAGAALQAIPLRKPDLVLLDIKMPGSDGLSLAKRLAADHGPLVVFVTAYDEHALEAFRIHAADYVLKPVDRARLLDAVEHARVAVRRTRAEQARADAGAAADAEGVGTIAKLAVRDGHRTHFLALSDVLWVESYGNYARVFTPLGRYTHRATMARIAEELAPHGFVRIHRGVIANALRIVRLEPKRGGQYEALLDTGARLPVSRGFRAELETVWSPRS